MFQTNGNVTLKITIRKVSIPSSRGDVSDLDGTFNNGEEDEVSQSPQVGAMFQT